MGGIWDEKSRFLESKGPWTGEGNHLQNSSNEYFFPDEIWDGDGFTD
jgi:hypothetical protein